MIPTTFHRQVTPIEAPLKMILAIIYLMLTIGNNHVSHDRTNPSNNLITNDLGYLPAPILLAQAILPDEVHVGKC